MDACCASTRSAPSGVDASGAMPPSWIGQRSCAKWRTKSGRARMPTFSTSRPSRARRAGATRSRRSIRRTAARLPRSASTSLPTPSRMHPTEAASSTSRTPRRRTLGAGPGAAASGARPSTTTISLPISTRSSSTSKWLRHQTSLPGPRGRTCMSDRCRRISRRREARGRSSIRGLLRRLRGICQPSRRMRQLMPSRSRKARRPERPPSRLRLA